MFQDIQYLKEGNSSLLPLSEPQKTTESDDGEHSVYKQALPSSCNVNKAGVPSE
jgi:hypothetical protein